MRVLSRVFRGKFVAGLRKLYGDGKLAFSGTLAHLRTPQAFAAFLRSLFRSDWVVYSAIGQCDQAVVGDSDAMGVGAEIVQNMLSTTERSL